MRAFVERLGLEEVDYLECTSFDDVFDCVDRGRCEYGVVALAALMIWYTAGLESFGKPYTAPFTGADAGALVRVLLKRPNRANKLRGAQLAGWNRRRQR